MAVQPTGYWTFFSNPAKWEIDRFLASNIERDDYTITDWQRSWFRPGQLGVVRVGVDKRTKEQLAGRPRLQPGIYAIVEVLSTPRDRNASDDTFWLAEPPTPDTRLVVEIRYLSNLLRRPVLLSELQTAAGVYDEYLLRGFQAATMPLAPAMFAHIVARADVEQQLTANIGPEPVDTAAQIAALEAKYADAVPIVREAISRRIERGAVAQEIKRLAGYQCAVCSALQRDPIAFRKPSGEPYIEIHHVIPVAQLRRGTLGPSNLLPVCANHHRQLHFGDVELLETTADAFIYRIDTQRIRVARLRS